MEDLNKVAENGFFLVRYSAHKHTKEFIYRPWPWWQHTHRRLYIDLGDLVRGGLVRNPADRREKYKWSNPCND